MTALDPKSWANASITHRWPEIARRIFSENKLTPAIMERIEALIADIPNAPIREICDPGAPDEVVWNQSLPPYLGKNWLEVPWFFAEHYFYRRVIEAIGYFQPGDGCRLDPFLFQKQHGLELSRAAIRDLAQRVAGWMHPGGDRESLIRLLYLDLWGNQADLSMWPADGASKPGHADLDQAREFLLADQAADVADYLLQQQTTEIFENLRGLRVDFVIDNAGFELVSDLVLADYLLSTGIAAQVRFHVKPHPTYVSDAMIKDVRATLDFFRADADLQVNALGSRLAGFWEQDQLQVRKNFFWTSPLPGWEMPIPLREELSAADLVISKGDANYRRLLGDLDWPYLTPFGEILAYFPIPVVALRTVKAEIICGLKPGQAEQVTAQDPGWMVNGRWGVVQFARPLTTDR